MVNDYVPTNPCPTRVYVNGTRIPAADVDVHLRKEGPLDINRYAEVNFASPWNDKDFLGEFDSIKELTQEDVNSAAPNLDQLLENEAPSPDTLRIDCRNQGDDAYNVLFHGIVTGVGDSPNGNRKIHHCRAQGPEHYLDKIPASKQWNRTTVEDVIQYVVNELNKNYVLDIGLGDVNVSVAEDTADGTNPLSLSNFLNPRLLYTEDLITGKTFQANKHTLANVVGWLTDKVGGRTWIQPTLDGASFFIIKNVTTTSTNHKAHYLNNGNTRIINNTALKQIKPLNTIILNGKAAETFAEVGDFEINMPAGKFTQVKARHDVLYQRNNQKELTETIRKSDSESKEEVIQEAKSILKQKVDEATSGSMQVTHDRFIQPFDTIEARPTVNGQSNEVSPLTYEVHRCHYKAHPNENTVPHIDLNCGVQTNVEEDITIISENKKEA
jgi:hypothetical protein